MPYIVEQLARLDVLGEYREDEGRGEPVAGVIPSLPPPIFSRVDLPSEYEFKQNPAVAAVENSSKLVLENAQLPLMADTAMQLLNLAKLRRCVAYGTDFNSPNIRSYIFDIVCCIVFILLFAVLPYVACLPFTFSLTLHYLSRRPRRQS